MPSGALLARKTLCFMRKEDKRLSNRIDPTSVLRPSDLLNLPDAPDFISKPPEYTAGEMVKL